MSDYQKALEWSKSNPTHPDAIEFMTKYAKPEDKITPVQGYKQDTIKSQPKINDIFDTIGRVKDYSLKAGKELIEQPSYGAQEAMRGLGKLLGAPPQSGAQGDYKPETFFGKTARLTGETFTPMAPGLPAGAAETAMQAGPRITAAVKASKPGQLATKTGQAIKKTAMIPVNAIKSTYPTFAEIMSGIPEKVFKFAAQEEKAGRSIFNEPVQPNFWGRLATETQNAFKAKIDEIGQKVGKYKAEFRNNPERVYTDTWVNDIDQFIQYKSGTEAEKSALSAPMLNKLSEVKKALFPKVTEKTEKKLQLGPGGIFETIEKPITEIGETVPAWDLQIAKEKIDEVVNWGMVDKNKPMDTETEWLLKKIRNEVNEEIGRISPELAAYNQDYSKLLDIKSTLGPNFNQTRISNTLRKVGLFDEMFEDDVARTTGMTVSEALHALDSILPKDKKFIDKARRGVAKEEFYSLYPGKPGSSSTKSGAAQHLRQEMLPEFSIKKAIPGLSSAGVAYNALNLPASLAMLFSMSPKGQGQILKRATNISNIPDYLLRQANRPAVKKTAVRLPKLLLGEGNN